ncbi:hypothetical protein EMPG_15362 [Blastomyces silverae]|uniref:Uncharacterized protein n=1 Tax=Blastomyces silverae TaxID=2060906 RepID=A0A0H1BJ74_9EURO|nr:hypothetical protein EMPG_15362 [Blastomyces silverae]
MVEAVGSAAVGGEMAHTAPVSDAAWRGRGLPVHWLEQVRADIASLIFHAADDHIVGTHLLQVSVKPPNGRLSMDRRRKLGASPIGSAACLSD